MSPEEPRMLTIQQIAQLLLTTKRTVHLIMAREPDFPKPIRLSRKLVRWWESEIWSWLMKKQAQANDRNVGK